MASNPMQKKSRNSFLLGMLLMLIIAAIAMIFMFLMLTKNNKKEEEKKVAQKQVYIVNKALKSGEEIEDVNLKATLVNEDMIPADAYGPGDLGDLYKTIQNSDGEEVEVSRYKAKIDMLPGTVLSEKMIYEGDELLSSERIQEYNMLQLPIALEIGDYVDVRLQLSNGQDYIVISHKEVKDISNATIWLQMKEEEILLMSNAMVESYISPATNLYVTKYVEAGIQGKAEITYIPSAAVINLIREDANVITEAKNSLINRYNSQQAFRDNIQNELNNFSDQKIEKIQSKILEARDKAQQEREEFLNGVR